MSLPVTPPYVFGNVTSSIPLTNLDSDFATIYAAVNGIGNGTVALANVVITGGTISNVSETATSYVATKVISTSSNVGAYSYGTLSYSDVNLFESFAASANTYVQNVLQNTNSGTAASVDYVVSNNLGTATTYYGDYGMNGSGWAGTAGTNSFNAPNMVYLTSTTADLLIGTTTSNAVRFAVNGGADSAYISTAGVFTIVNDATIHGLTVGLGGGSVVGNTVAGANALSGNTSGGYNTAFGYYAGASNVTNVAGTFIGYEAGIVSVADANTFVGYQTGKSTTSGTNNTAMAVNALYANTAGSQNTAYGRESLFSNTVSSNSTAVGYQAGYNSTGASNTFLGCASGVAVTTGSNLTVVGYSASASSATATNEVTLGNSSVIVWRFPGTTVVASLPSASTVGAGARSFVTNALTPVFGSAVVGGGAVSVPVYSNGTTWCVG